MEAQRAPDKLLKPWLMACLLGLASPAAESAWTAPQKPDPAVILREAEADTKAKRYEDALAKHVWFHQNALKHDAALYGVRLSFALGSWMELAKHYRPATEALKEVRDQAGARIREGKGQHGDFHDFSSLNEMLGEERATADLFAWLDQNNPALAKRSYGVAQGALIHAKQYRLCGKYIDSQESLGRLLRLYREHQRMAKDPRFGRNLQDFADSNLSHGASTLVALLVLNERTAEADSVVAAVLKATPDAGLKKKLSRAREGVLPEPWPKRAG
jgi:hypothetical protein